VVSDTDIADYRGYLRSGHKARCSAGNQLLEGFEGAEQLQEVLKEMMAESLADCEKAVDRPKAVEYREEQIRLRVADCNSLAGTSDKSRQLALLDGQVNRAVAKGMIDMELLATAATGTIPNAAATREMRDVYRSRELERVQTGLSFLCPEYSLLVRELQP